MKTAVSIPDDVFAQADELAAQLNVSRSQLYATALRALVAQQESVTRQLDLVHGGLASDDAVTAAARRTFADSSW
jgi:predicted transcriptional regulator